MPTQREAERRHTIHYLKVLSECLEAADWPTIIWNEANIRLALDNALNRISTVKASWQDALAVNDEQTTTPQKDTR